MCDTCAAAAPSFRKNSLTSLTCCWLFFNFLFFIFDYAAVRRANNSKEVDFLWSILAYAHKNEAALKVRRFRKTSKASLRCWNAAPNTTRRVQPRVFDHQQKQCENIAAGSYCFSAVFFYPHVYALIMQIAQARNDHRYRVLLRKVCTLQSFNGDSVSVSIVCGYNYESAE